MDYLSSILILTGSLFILIAAIGLLRMSDLYMQLHAATKAGVLGSGLLLLGVGIKLTDMHSITEIFLLILFIALTNPIAAHLVAKTALEKSGLER